jgi:fructokinase
MNVAVGLARLGRPTTLATWYGNDRRGELIATQLRESGVAPLPGSDKATRTPTARVSFDAYRSATYEFDLEWRMPPLGALSAAPVIVHTGSIGATLAPGAADVLDAVRILAPHATVSYDPNARPQLIGGADANCSQIEACVACADIVKASAEDLEWLYGTADGVARRWLGSGESGPKLLVVTQGADGVEAWTSQGAHVHVPSERVKVADTVGAGDSFMSALIHALWEAELLGAEHRTELSQLDEVRLTEVLAFCTHVAAITVSRPGANPPWLCELT